MNANRLLAIDPGSREMGVAVFYDNELRYYAVKTVSKRNAQGVPAEAARIVRSLIEEHQPLNFAIAQPLVIHQSAEGLARVIRAIKSVALHEELAVYIRSPRAVRRFICSSERATKKETYERVCAIYPELAQYADKLKLWDDYYEPMFNAVALGLTCTLNEESQTSVPQPVDAVINLSPDAR